MQLAKQPLPAQHDNGGANHRPCRIQLTGDGAKEQAVEVGGPVRGQAIERHRVGGGDAPLAPAGYRFEVLEHWSRRQAHEMDLHAGRADEVDLARPRRLGVDADRRSHADAEPRQREAAVGDRAAEAPAARVVHGQVTRRRAGDQDEG